jgi:hypothetical protein
VKPLVVCIVILVGGCEDGRSPTTPDRPIGRPNATALANLDLIRDLESRERESTVLVSVGAPSQLDGRVASGDGWAYSFLDTRPNLDEGWVWTVRSSGEISVVGPVPATQLFDRVDIAPLLAVDSDEAISLARGYGAQAYLAKHPQALVQVAYRRLAGEVVCQLHFLDISPSRDGCEIDIYIHATAGTLMARDLSCLL